MNASAQGWSLGFFPPFSLLTDKDQPQVFYLQIHLHHEAQNQVTVSSSFQLPHQSIVNWSHPSHLFSHPQWCLVESWGSTWSLALFACLSSLESDAGRALLAGNNAYDHRGVLPAFSLFFLDN